MGVSLFFWCLYALGVLGLLPVVFAPLSALRVFVRLSAFGRRREDLERLNPSIRVALDSSVSSQLSQSEQTVVTVHVAVIRIAALAVFLLLAGLPLGLAAWHLFSS
jgi:hypothetical protein